MAIIEATGDDGQLIEVTEVMLSKSGTQLLITDDEGRFIALQRASWAQFVSGVNRLLEQAAGHASATETKRKR